MPRVGFDATIPVFEREKTVHALGRTVTVTSNPLIIQNILKHDIYINIQ
jgi:hypothetical protein